MTNTLNIFDYYEKDENNLTKAFINLLQYSKKENVLIPLVDFLGIPNSIRNPRFELQKKGIKFNLNKETRVILAISPFGQINKKKDSTIEESLPDAWIIDDSLLILIENKIKTLLDEEQLKRHCNSILIEYDKKKIIVKSWIYDIYPFFEGIMNKLDKGGVDYFLIKQFLEFMEVNEMYPFKKIEKKMRKSGEGS